MTGRFSALVSSADGYAYGPLHRGAHELVVAVRPINDGIESARGHEGDTMRSTFYYFHAGDAVTAKVVSESNDVKIGNGRGGQSLSQDGNDPAAGTAKALNNPQDPADGNRDSTESDSRISSNSVGAQQRQAVAKDATLQMKNGLRIIHPRAEAALSGDKLNMQIAVPYSLLQVANLKMEFIFDDARFDLTDAMWEKLELDAAKVARAQAAAVAHGVRVMGGGNAAAGDGGGDTKMSGETVPISGGVGVRDRAVRGGAGSASRWWAGYAEREIFEFEVGGKTALVCHAPVVRIVA